MGVPLSPTLTIENNKIYLPDWYQLDFIVPSQGHKYLLQRIAELINNLKRDFISKWFFLYEKTTIRLRYRTKNPAQCELEINDFISKQDLAMQPVSKKLFEKYFENKKDFPNKAVLKAFVNIMYEISRLTIKKLKNPNKFNNFKLVGRISHCVYNNVYGLPAEAYYLFKRLNFNFNYENREEDPEYTILDNNSELLSLENINLGFKINVPFKKQRNH